MQHLSEASKILLQRNHTIDGTRVKVGPHRGFADIRPLLIKGDYRLRINGLHEYHLNRTLETAFRPIGPHTLITIRKDDEGATTGQADIWFVRENVALEARAIAITKGWEAELHIGPPGFLIPQE